jgi:hypothetical protein
MKIHKLSVVWLTVMVLISAGFLLHTLLNMDHTEVRKLPSFYEGNELIKTNANQSQDKQVVVSHQVTPITYQNKNKSMHMWKQGIVYVDSISKRLPELSINKKEHINSRKSDGIIHNSSTGLLTTSEDGCFPTNIYSGRGIVVVITRSVVQPKRRKERLKVIAETWGKDFLNRGSKVCE